MVDLSGTDRKSLVDRAKAMILSPKEEWPKIALETAPQSEVLRGYVLPLAAIGPVASFIGEQVFGLGFFGFSYRPSVVWSLSDSVVHYVLSIVNVFLVMFIADFLAPHFGGASNRAGAFKLAAYGFTAYWLAGIFALIPSLLVFSLLGFYSLYLLYTGVTPMMQVPQDKALGYTVVTGLCALLLAVVAMKIAAPITGLWTSGPNAPDEVSGKVTVPGGGSIDLDKVQQATKQMEAAANGKSPPVAPDRMKALLPETIGAYQRSATEGVAMGAAGSTAQGTYTAGDKSFTLKIADMSALGALSGLGAAMGVEQSKEDADSYEKTTSVNGQIQTEAWNKTTNTGKYSITVNNRFMIEAEGSAGSIDELKQAVGSIDQDDLADLVG